MALMVVNVQNNRLHIQWDEVHTDTVSGSFSHPRSLIGNWSLLLQLIKQPIQLRKSQRAWWQMPEVLHVLWVLPPQQGGLLDLERRALRELTYSAYSGRVYGYVVESTPLNYAHWQATIPTLGKL